MIQAFIFDLDGTLYPRTNPLYQSMSARIRQWFQEQLRIHSEDMDEYYEWLKRTYPSPFDAIEQFGLSVASYHAEVFGELDPELSLNEDIDLCESLKQLPGQKFLVTQSSREHAERVLKVLNVCQCFSEIYVYGLNWHSRRKIDAYEMIRQRNGWTPAQVCIIGDNLIVDLHDAHTIGYSCVAVSDCSTIGNPSVQSIREIPTLLGFSEGNPEKTQVNQV